MLEDKSFFLHAGTALLFDASQKPFEYLCTGASWDFWWFEFRRTEPDFPSLPLETVLSLPLEEFHLRLCSEALASLKLKNSVAASSLLISLLSLLGRRITACRTCAEEWGFSRRRTGISAAIWPPPRSSPPPCISASASTPCSTFSRRFSGCARWNTSRI